MIYGGLLKQMIVNPAVDTAGTENYHAIGIQ